ncbi:hypothetical protein K8T06_16865, partial [bacterium]|nr:hypothetical protein [bacterium]
MKHLLSVTMLLSVVILFSCAQASETILYPGITCSLETDVLESIDVCPRQFNNSEKHTDNGHIDVTYP